MIVTQITHTVTLKFGSNKDENVHKYEVREKKIFLFVKKKISKLIFLKSYR